MFLRIEKDIHKDREERDKHILIFKNFTNECRNQECTVGWNVLYRLVLVKDVWKVRIIDNLDHVC